MWFVVTDAGILLHLSKENSYYASVYMHACRDTFVISIFKDAGNNTEYWAWDDYRIAGNICGNCVVLYF